MRLRQRGAVAGGLLTLLVTALLLASCSGGGPKQPAESEAKGRFVGLVRQEPETLDPHTASSAPTRKLFIAVYEPLVRVKPGGTELEGVLAEEWTVSPDAKTFTFKIRKGVKFHDGSDLDAAAVKASFERMKKIGLGDSWVLKDVVRIDTPDPHTVEITLANSNIAFLDALPLVNIISLKAIQEHAKGDDLAQDWLKEHEAGTGPYCLKEWIKGERLVLGKFPDYWRGWAGSHFSELVIRKVEETSTQRVMMEAGEGDWADTIDIDDLDAMEKSGKFTVVSEPGPAVCYIMMNENKPPLDSPKVRRAIRYAFDYETMVRDIMKGRGEVPRGYLAPLYPEHDGGPAEEYDLDKAKRLLAEAGYPNGGFTLELMYFSPFTWERMASELLADRLAKLGVTLQIQGLPHATMLTKHSDPVQRPHMAYYYVSTTSSPDSLFGQTFTSRSTHWSAVYKAADPVLDNLIEEARRTVDNEQRTATYRKIQELLREDSPGVASVIQHTIHVFRHDVKGFKLFTFMPYLVDYYSLYRE